MSDDRRFDEAEVNEILERATSLERSGALARSHPSNGFTLSQLQEIGAEVGIPPERIADAAFAIANRIPAPGPRTFLGAPRFVSRVVQIRRALDDDEWNRLVVALRETFGALGRIQVYSTLRSWNNGNLQVHVEPTDDGYRVRMQTMRGDAYPRAAIGVLAVGVSGALLVTNSLSGLAPSSVVVAGVIGLVGLGQLGVLRLRLRRWAADRAAQMEALVARIQRLLAVFALALAFTGSCTPSPKAPPSADERALAVAVGLTDSAFMVIREVASDALQPLRPSDSTGNVLPARGVSFGIDQNKTQRTITRLRERLGPGYLVFKADQGYGITPDSIGIIVSKDPFDILRVRSTDGINYDIDHDSVLALVSTWDRQYGLEITGAGMDWFEARFIRAPANWLAFAKELYKVCPDIVDQGAESVEALADEMRRTNMLYCWWD